MLQGNIKAKVLYLIDKEKGSVVMASVINEKTVESVTNVLKY